MNPLSDEQITVKCPKCKMWIRLRFDEKGHLKTKEWFKPKVKKK